jgi:hypothetical protein
MDWQLMRVDLNRDVQVKPELFFNMTHSGGGFKSMQFKTAAGVFRIYAKSLNYGHHWYIRQEEMLPKDAVGPSFTEEAIYDVIKNHSDTDPYSFATTAEGEEAVEEEAVGGAEVIE